VRNFLHMYLAIARMATQRMSYSVEGWCPNTIHTYSLSGCFKASRALNWEHDVLACRAVAKFISRGYAGEDEQGISKATTAEGSATGEFTSALAEAQKMFSNISVQSSELGSSVGTMPRMIGEAGDDELDDFLPPPPASLFTPALQAMSDPAPDSQPPAADSAANEALAQNWLRVAAPKPMPIKTAGNELSTHKSQPSFESCVVLPLAMIRCAVDLEVFVQVV
jgi:hypothetical protein